MHTPHTPTHKNDEEEKFTFMYTNNTEYYDVAIFFVSFFDSYFVFVRDKKTQLKFRNRLGSRKSKGCSFVLFNDEC